MSGKQGTSVATVNKVALTSRTTKSDITLPDYDKDRLEQVGFLTAMTLVIMGNYAQTGHFGGPLAYTPYTVTSHLVVRLVSATLFTPAPPIPSEYPCPPG